MNPCQLPRRVLLCVTGLSPQIITETLYALVTRKNDSFIPTEIHLITTGKGSQEARLQLLSSEPGWFRRFCADYCLDPAKIHFGNETIHQIQTADGRSLDDIRTPADNTAVADAITGLVRKLTADPDSAIHASIAGGRKTMGFYLGYALSLFGRSQDRLSHVLVSSPFESNPNFFYPTPQERVIHTKDGLSLDAKDAVVMLADIPFVRLRDGLQENLLDANASFSAVVEQAQRNLGPPELTLYPASCQVRCWETVIRLKPISFAWLSWFARRAQAELPPLHWKQIGAAETESFLNEHKQVLGFALNDDSCALINGRRAKGIDKAFFEERNSKLKRELIKALGTRSALSYSVQRQGTERRSGYALNLTPRQIHFVASDEA